MRRAQFVGFVRRLESAEPDELRKASSFESHHQRKKLLVMNVDPAVLIGVVPSKSVGETLELNAELNKVVEKDDASTCWI